MAHYLVTGGAGFIGSHLCEALLERNHQVTVLDNLSNGTKENLIPSVTFVEGDIRDFSLVQKLMTHVDGCFHLAAISSVKICNDDWVAANQVNVIGTINILENARVMPTRRCIIPVVFASSASVYGNCEKLPCDENDRIFPISSYGVSKLSGENYARITNLLCGVPVTAVRIFNVYGPRQTVDSSYSGVITKFLNNLINDQPLKIYGNGEQTRDFIFVKDVVKFMLAAMNNNSHSMKIYNVCSGKSTSVIQIANALASIMKKKPHFLYERPQDGDIYASLGNPELAAKELGIKAETALKEGLRVYIEAE